MCECMFVYVLEGVGVERKYMIAILSVSEVMWENLYNDFWVLSCKYTSFGVYECVSIWMCMCLCVYDIYHVKISIVWIHIHVYICFCDLKQVYTPVWYFLKSVVGLVYFIDIFCYLDNLETSAYVKRI